MCNVPLQLRCLFTIFLPSFFSFHFIFHFFFALMCIAESHSKRCAITINLINCAARGKKRGARARCVLECGREQIHERHTIYSNFNSILFTFTWAQHKKPSNIAFTQNEKPLVVLFKRYRMCDNSLVAAYMLVGFIPLFSFFFFNFSFQQTENNNNFDFINFVSIRCWFLFFHFYFSIWSRAHTHTQSDRWTWLTHISPFIHMCQIWSIRKCI